MVISARSSEIPEESARSSKGDHGVPYPTAQLNPAESHKRDHGVITARTMRTAADAALGALLSVKAFEVAAGLQ